MENYRFRVEPCEYHRGFCPALCETVEDAWEELVFWNSHTDFQWIIEGVDEQAEQELSAYLDMMADEIME